MPTLPSFSKTWNSTAHTIVPTQGSALASIQASLRLGIVGALLAMATGAPTVAGSSNSTTGAMDAVNRWTSNGAIIGVASSGAHSWIVLTFGSKFQLCIDLVGSVNLLTISMYGSPSLAYTGGSNTARPTATDEVTFFASATWINSNTDVQRCWHVWMPTDSSAFRWVEYLNNVMDSFGFVEIPINTPTNWTGPLVGMAKSASTLIGAPTYANLNTTGAGIGARWSSGAFTCGLTAEAISGSTVGQTLTVPDSIDGGYYIGPSPGLYSATAGSLGRHGTIVDMWWISTFPNANDVWPSTGTPTHINVGNLLYPNADGALTLQTS